MPVVKKFDWTCAIFLGFLHLCNHCYILSWQVQYFFGECPGGQRSNIFKAFAGGVFYLVINRKLAPAEIMVPTRLLYCRKKLPILNLIKNSSLYRRWAAGISTKKLQLKIAVLLMIYFSYATLSILILLVLNLRCAYSNVTSNVFTF